MSHLDPRRYGANDKLRTNWDETDYSIYEQTFANFSFIRKLFLCRTLHSISSLYMRKIYFNLIYQCIVLIFSFVSHPLTHYQTQLIGWLFAPQQGGEGRGGVGGGEAGVGGAWVGGSCGDKANECHIFPIVHINGPCPIPFTSRYI